MTSSRFLTNHFSITPENFPTSKKNEGKVKALHIPKKASDPKIYFDSPSSIKSSVFDKDFSSLVFVPLHPYYHMYVDNISMLDHLDYNLVATYLYRYSLSTMVGYSAMNVVSGDALIFGSVSASTQDNYDVDYSVPYEIVEQVARYYDQGMIL